MLITPAYEPLPLMKAHIGVDLQQNDLERLPNGAVEVQIIPKVPFSRDSAERLL
jgi:hypothetical protein